MKAGRGSPSSGGIRGWLAGQRAYVDYRTRHVAAALVRALASIRSRGAIATVRLAATRMFPPPLQPFRIELFEEFRQGDEIRLPDPSSPVASIVVPVHGQLEFTLRCLHSLARSGDRTAFEVILVDDASDDDSGSVLPRIPGLRYQRNQVNLGFIGSCNAGAAAARGTYLVLLNNDTVVQPGWLDALLQTFTAHPDTGLAGSKLVYPDGRLQEAGGIVFADGSAANYGRNGDPSDPRFNFVREADYCSGAAIAIPLALFTEFGGLDDLYAPAYYEDTDLAMRIRRHGLKVRYQPASVVVHFEGATSGTDPSSGAKAYQAINQRKFLERWAAVLAASHPPRNDSGPGAWAMAATHRYTRHVLIIDSYTPTPDRDSGSGRMVELMAMLLDEGCSVTFFNQSLVRDGGYTDDLQQLGVEAWWRPWLASVPAWLKEHGPRFDAIIVSRHYVLSPLLPLFTRFAPKAKLVFDTVDLHFLRELREAEHSGLAADRRKSERTREVELRLVRAADHTWVVSAVERELLVRLSPESQISVVSNIHRSADTPSGFEARDGGVFFGSFRHPPNVDAALWLVNDILPLVRQQLPGFRLHLVGADAPASVIELARHAGVEYRGHVPDLDALLDTCRLSVAPLRYGAGIKGKVNHSLARGLPVVATGCAIEGMSLESERDVLLADDAAAFAGAIVRVYSDQSLWQRLREGGRENTTRHFSPESARAVVRPWLQALR